MPYIQNVIHVLGVYCRFDGFRSYCRIYEAISSRNLDKIRTIKEDDGSILPIDRHQFGRPMCVAFFGYPVAAATIQSNPQYQMWPATWQCHAIRLGVHVLITIAAATNAFHLRLAYFHQMLGVDFVLLWNIEDHGLDLTFKKNIYVFKHLYDYNRY